MNLDYLISDLYSRFLSRKFLAGILALGLFLADNFKLIELDSETKKYVLTVILGYLVVEGSADTVRAYKQ